MAAQKSPKSQTSAAQGSVGGDGDRGVLRAGGQKFAALAGRERMNRRRDPAAVEGEQGKQYATHGIFGAAGGLAFCFIRAVSIFAC